MFRLISNLIREKCVETQFCSMEYMGEIDEIFAEVEAQSLITCVIFLLRKNDGYKS